MTFLIPSSVIIILETRGTVTVTSVMLTAGLWSQRQGPGHVTRGLGPGPRSGRHIRDIMTSAVVREGARAEKIRKLDKVLNRSLLVAAFY